MTEDRSDEDAATADEVVHELARLWVGLQVPVSVGVPLGIAREAWDALKENLPFGWLDVPCVETNFCELLGMGEHRVPREGMIEVPLVALQTVFDAAIASPGFQSGNLDDEEVNALRKVASYLNVDPLLATPEHHKCKYLGEHVWRAHVGPLTYVGDRTEPVRLVTRVCDRCSAREPAYEPDAPTIAKLLAEGSA